MTSEHNVINSIARASFQLRALLLLMVAALAFHVHAVRIAKASPLAHPDSFASSAQNPVVVICAFATVMGLIVAGAVASTWLWQLWPFHKPDPRPDVQDYVPLRLARKLALLERDALWIERTGKMETVRKRSRNYKERNEWLLFALLVLLVIDLRCPESAAVTIGHAFGFEDIQYLLWVLCVLVGLAWCCLVLWDDPMLDWIEHPELAVKHGSEFRPSTIAALASRQSTQQSTCTPHSS